MTPLTLRLKVRPPCRIDAAPLSPRGLAGKSRAEIERIALGGWNETFAVGALFAVRGEDAGRVVLQGLEGSFLRVGAGLDGGELTVVGQSGDYAGESMTGGAITVHGDAGDYLGVGMKGGSITCTGNAGAFTGSGRAGELRGMTGGAIVIRGSAGDRTGDRMRRGLLLVEGRVGDYCAARMLAGTLVALGAARVKPGLSHAPGHGDIRRSRGRSAAYVQPQRRRRAARHSPAASVARPLRPRVQAARPAGRPVVAMGRRPGRRRQRRGSCCS